MTSLGWTPGAVSGVVESECVTRIEHPVELQTVAGHESVTQTALMDASGDGNRRGLVSAVTGSVAGERRRSSPTERRGSRCRWEMGQTFTQ